MATYTPPTEILPIFDSSVYQGDQTGLTVSTGDARYLKFPTAQGLETFNAGLNTTSIGSTLTSIKYLWNTIAGAILIGDQSSLIGLGSTTTNTQIQNIESSSGTRRKLWMTNTDRIDIGSASTLINIGDSPATASSISIGDNLSTTYIPGTVSCGLITTGTMTINSIQPKAGIDTVNLYNTTSTAQINLGTQANRSAILNIGDGTDSTGAVHINNGVRATGNTQIMNGANASGTLNLGSSAVGNTVVINVNRPLTIGYNPSAITAGQIGYSIKYTWVSGVIPNGSSFTFGSFTNTPVGIYLLTVGTFTAFAFDPLDRLNMGYTATTNITFLSSSTTMEFGGNALTKMGIGYSVPISITNSTNQLTVSGSVSGSDVNYLEGASSLVRIA
jgi:hypothetical protein